MVAVIPVVVVFCSLLLYIISWFDIYFWDYISLIGLGVFALYVIICLVLAMLER